jgi:hypothetical protein
VADALDLAAWRRAVRAGEAATRHQARLEREVKAAREAELARLAAAAQQHARAVAAWRAAGDKARREELKSQAVAASGRLNGLDILGGFAHGDRNRSSCRRAAEVSDGCARALTTQRQNTAAATERLVLQRQRLEHVRQSACEQCNGLAQALELIQEMEIEDDAILAFTHRLHGA